MPVGERNRGDEEVMGRFCVKEKNRDWQIVLDVGEYSEEEVGGKEIQRDTI